MIECEEKVSVLIPTYNHKDYIARALNSVLMQKTNFNFTIWIADDHSTDGTSEIIQDIIKDNHNHKATIHHIIAEKNLGVKNKVIHFDNILTSNELKNQYVALCGGDDYWINDCKLQQQYDILRENKNYSSISDSYISLKADGPYITQHKNMVFKKNKALLYARNPFSQGSSFMFKNIVDWEYFPDVLHDDGGFTKILNCYGDNIFREIATTVYDRTVQGLCAVHILPNLDVGQQLNYLTYLLVRIIHYIQTDENLLLEADHEFILNKLNKDWIITDYCCVNDHIVNFVEQYKAKREKENIPHYKTDMVFEVRPEYKIIL